MVVGTYQDQCLLDNEKCRTRPLPFHGRTRLIRAFAGFSSKILEASKRKRLASSLDSSLPWLFGDNAKNFLPWFFVCFAAFKTSGNEAANWACHLTKCTSARMSPVASL